MWRGACIRAWSVPELALTHGAWALTLTRALCLCRPGSGPGPWSIPGTGPNSHNKPRNTDSPDTNIELDKQKTMSDTEVTEDPGKGRNFFLFLNAIRMRERGQTQ